MRLRKLLGFALVLLIFPTLAGAKSKTYNEATIEKLDGTIMVQRNDGSKPFAVQTGTTLQKGDILTVYDKSWVIFKTHKGDRIGLDSNTTLVIDEYFIEGPDRQIRFLLQKGTLFLRTNGCGSRQSFFEINSGSLVTAINDTQAILSYEPGKDHLRVQYLYGKLSVVDKDNERKFSDMHTERNWEGGKMVESADTVIPVEELDVLNYNRFYSGDTRLTAASNNILMPEK
ncbi:MAG TPA: hypothetical protein VMV05_07320 [bacterium]|nr:hypothetical protein [bacterium]